MNIETESMECAFLLERIETLEDAVMSSYDKGVLDGMAKMKSRVLDEIEYFLNEEWRINGAQVQEIIDNIEIK